MAFVCVHFVVVETGEEGEGRARVGGALASVNFIFMVCLRALGKIPIFSFWYNHNNLFSPLSHAKSRVNGQTSSTTLIK